MIFFGGTERSIWGQYHAVGQLRIKSGFDTFDDFTPQQHRLHISNPQNPHKTPKLCLSLY